MINSTPLRVAVTGATGRMGREIIQCIRYQYSEHINSKIVLGAAIVKDSSRVCDIDTRSIDQSNVSKVIITDNIKLVKDYFDILIDFTSPQSTIEYLNFCVKYRKNMIIGTTGFDENHLFLIQQASQKIGIVYSPNFSIGIAVMCKLLTEVARSIGNCVDIDIIEIHHNKKNDIPSGTALMMCDLIKNNITNILSSFSKNTILRSNNDLLLKHESLCKPSIAAAKSKRDIKIHSIRSGDVVGEHTGLFAGSGECLKITHKAFNRSIFANGALCSALWLKDKKVGLFDLNSVLGFKTV